MLSERWLDAAFKSRLTEKKEKLSVDVKFAHRLIR